MDLTTAPLYGLAAIGLLLALKYVENALSYVYCHFLRPSKNIKKRYGSWTVVTGATDGIGKAMAFELAKRGLNVVLISRSKDKLIECAAELTAKYPKIEVKVLDVDFSDFSATVRTRVTSFLEGLDVGVLINNVGISYPFTKFFHELDDDRVEQLITLNVNSTTWMSRYCNSTFLFEVILSHYQILNSER
jgi:17beta-estradiol 17-dehydrogenase / very-long-chain 3-oxoacyl-CoA reductase